MALADNGGSTLAIAGDDFAVVAGDTRNTSGYSINTRYAPKVFHIGDNIIASVVGFAADGDALVKRIQHRVEWYHHAHDRPISIKAAARMVQTILYGKRFFPFYTHVILGGLDADGKGAVYSFDPVGSYEREQCRAAGAAASLIMPFLDNQVNLKNQLVNGHQREVTALSVEEVLRLVKE